MSVLQSDLLRQQCFINGQWCDADQGQTLAAYNPFNQQQLGVVPLCGVDETQRAIAAADYAMKGLACKPAKERSALLYRWYELILEHINSLAELITLECGKPLSEARGEVQYVELPVGNDYAQMCTPALAAGCAVVIKPAELTPFCALALAVLAQQAEMPRVN